MEFKGIGILPYQTPPDDLRPFFKRKYTTFFRSFGSVEPKVLTRKDVAKWVVKGTKHIKDAQEKEETANRYMNMYVLTLLGGNDQIEEEEFVNNWMKQAFDTTEARKMNMHQIMYYMQDLFNAVDSNRDGRIDFDEFTEFYDIFEFNTSTTARDIFDTLDADGNGTISVDEFAYAKLTFLMCCGPENPIKLFYGPLVDEKEISGQGSEETSEQESK